MYSSKRQKKGDEGEEKGDNGGTKSRSGSIASVRIDCTSTEIGERGRNNPSGMSTPKRDERKCGRGGGNTPQSEFHSFAENGLSPLPILSPASFHNFGQPSVGGINKGILTLPSAEWSPFHMSAFSSNTGVGYGEENNFQTFEDIASFHMLSRQPGTRMLEKRTISDANEIGNYVDPTSPVATNIYVMDDGIHDVHSGPTIDDLKRNIYEQGHHHTWARNGNRTDGSSSGNGDGGQNGQPERRSPSTSSSCPESPPGTSYGEAVIVATSPDTERTPRVAKKMKVDRKAGAYDKNSDNTSSSKKELKEKTVRSKDDGGSGRASPSIGRRTTCTEFLASPQPTQRSQTVSPPGLAGTIGGKPPTCNCKKSKCLKLYCDCFRMQVYCNGCHCSECSNTIEFEDKRQQSMQVILDRNPEAFKPRVSADGNVDGGTHLNGCNCKRSACLKKYCECFTGMVACTERCQCLSCANTQSFAASRKYDDIGIGKGAKVKPLPKREGLLHI